MNLSVDLPVALGEQLASHCQAHGITQEEAVRRAIRQFLNHSASPTPYALGAEGFGADQTHSGAIAENSQRLLRERFRASTTG